MTWRNANSRRAADPVRRALPGFVTTRLSRTDLFVTILVILGLLTVVGPPLLGQGVLLDVNLISSRLPFRALTGAAYENTIMCRQDTIDYFPAIAEIKHSLFRGELPTWAPWEVGGAPLAGLPNTGFLSPLALPYFLLPLWLAPAFVKFAEIVAAMTGMILFLRRRGVSWAGSWLAGFVFVTSGFMIMWSNWPQTRVAALIPLLLWAVDRVVELHRAKDVVAVAVVFASMLLGGFPAVTMYALMAAGAYVLVRVWVLYRRRWREAVGVLAAAVGSLALGLGSAAIQLVPFVANLSDVFAGRNKGGGHLPLATAITMIAPEARGSCRGGIWYGDVIPIEAVSYVGSGALVLVVLAIGFARRRREEPGTRSWLIGTLLVAASLIWIGGPLLEGFALLPVIGNNSITRAQSVVGFILACLVALGFDEMNRRSGAAGALDDPQADHHVHPWAATRRPAVVLAIFFAVTIAVFLAALIAARQDDYLDHLAVSLAVPILLLLAALSLIVLVYVGPRALAILGPIFLVALVVIQGVGFARTMLPLSQRDLFFPSNPTHQFLQAHLGPDRYGPGDNTADAALSDWYHLRTPTGHEFTDPRWKELLAAVDPDVQRTVTYSRFSPTLPVERFTDSPVLDRLAVRYWTASPRRAVGKIESLDKDGRVRLAVSDSAPCTVEAGPLRGINIYLTDKVPLAPPRSKPLLHVEVRVGSETRTGAVLLDGTAPGPGRVTVAVAGEDLPTGGNAKVRVWLTGTDGARYFAGKGKRLSCSRVVPDKDTDPVRLVSTDAGSAIYERRDSLPRVRWASQSRVIDPDKQVAALKAEVPTDTVLLDNEATSPAAGGSGSVSVSEDAGNRIVVKTDSTNQGYLVVADSIVRQGWTATVDGQPAPLVRADHALAAVPVPAGEHQVELTYRVPGFWIGATITAMSVLTAISLLAAPGFLLRRRRRLSPRAP